ncbi:MAG TPA: galactosyltransferase-related protein [Polyangia bacterium]|nr:galactosyltransferase-related protein [Polyangia bacterium]
MTAPPPQEAPVPPRERLAVLVPYRDRQRYLDIFLRDVPRYLEEVNGIRDYTIYVAEQTSPDLFNLSLSRNVAAGAALADGGFDYLVFHDVDIIPLERVDYGPRPFNVAWFLSAGSCKVRARDFVAANGYNPRFVGWGDEDVDFYHRLQHAGREVKEWHRLPESRGALSANLEWPELSDADALDWSRSYFGHRGDGPRFVAYPGSRERPPLERYDKSVDFHRRDKQRDNHALWNRVRALPAAQKSLYIRENGLSELRRERVRRERRDRIQWLRYRTDEVLQPAAKTIDLAPRPTPRTALFEVRSEDVGWGELTVDGSLGYDGGCCPVPRCRADLRGVTVVSAHAPSRLEIETFAPVEVFGLLNASATFNPRNPVEMWADWNFVGELRVPGEATAGLRLEPGHHLLVATCVEPGSRHTLWGIRAAAPSAPSRLTVLTIAACDDGQIPELLALFARSARKAGVDVRVCFAGEPYPSHSQMRIRRLRAVVDSLRTDRVAYVDGRDALFLAGPERLQRRFERAGAPLLVGTRRADGGDGPDPGVWIGERAAAARALAALEELVERAGSRPAPGELPGLARARREPDGDRAFWQAALEAGLIEAALDREGLLSRNLSGLELSLIDNRELELDAGDLPTISGRRPCVLHFSGHARGQAMHQWGSLFGAY